MKRLIVFLFLILCGVAHSAQIVNVEYIHNAIAQKWDITVPYNAELTNPRVAANMKYLLTVVDVANEMLNGEPTTDYGNGEYATLVAADTVATDTAVETLVKKIENQSFGFSVFGTPGQESSFAISAAGTFYIDWGDGTTETIEKTDTNYAVYAHTYATYDYYTVELSGVATAYSNDEYTSAIIFAPYYACDSERCNYIELDSIFGCLGCIFPTLDDGSQPRFAFTFVETPLQGEIPKNLFNGIYGAPVTNMFLQTFLGQGTLVGTIPSNLFGGLSGPLADGVFVQTFCGCDNLTGPSAQINGEYLYNIWPDATADQVSEMYAADSGLEDFANIPDVWK